MKEGWKYKKIGQVCEILNGFAFKSDEYEEKGVRVMRITNVQKGTVVDDDPKFFPLARVNEISRYLLREGDVLMSLTGNVGRVGIIEEKFLPAALNQRVACLRLKDKEVDKKYLFHILNSDAFENDCIFNAAGIAQKNMSTKWLEQYDIPVPPLKTQQHIVSELDLLQSIIDKQKAQLKELDNLAQAIFYDMFGDPNTNTKGWVYHSLAKLITDSMITYHLDGNHGGDYPKSEEFVENGVPYIGANCIVNGNVDFSLAKHLTIERANKLRKGIAINNDVLFAHNATVGPVAILKTNEEKVILSTSLTAFRCNEKSINPYFLKSYMVSEWFVRQYIGVMKQTTRNQVPITKQKEMLFITPPISLQQSFAAKIESIEKQKSAISKSIKETQKLFDYTMDKYFG